MSEVVARMPAWVRNLIIALALSLVGSIFTVGFSLVGAINAQSIVIADLRVRVESMQTVNAPLTSKVAGMSDDVATLKVQVQNNDRRIGDLEQLKGIRGFGR
jgi:hypothetical protein